MLRIVRELALDRLLHAAQPRGDLGVGVALQLPHAPPSARSSSPRRSGAGDIPRPTSAASSGFGSGPKTSGDGRVRQVGQREDSGRRRGTSGSRTGQVDRLAYCQDDQQLPEVVAVLEPGELAAPARRQKLSKALRDDVLLVGDAAPRQAAEPGAGQGDQARE